MYEKGNGVTKDYVEAARWYEKAAEKGDKSAQFNLGYAYQHGEGVSQDYAKFVLWYKKSAG